MFPKRRLLAQFLTYFAFVCCVCVSVASFATAQSSATTWKTWDQTFTREEPVTEYRWEEQEVMETSYRKKMVPVYQSETIEKKTISYRPVKKTSERVESYKELEPVTVTKYRPREVQETKYDTVVEMREEKFVSKRPVTETVMRDKKFNVREKVTEKTIQYRDVTTYKPTSVAETTLVPANVLVPAPATTGRAAIQWLRPGYYTDPITGLSAWKRRGLHWATPSAPGAAVIPALVPQVVAGTAYVPEVTREAEPVEVSRYVDRVETRSVPVEVQRIEETVETRKVPVEVKRARQVTRIEKIPYTETTYREVERTRRIPVVEETIQKVETIEPVEKTTAKWVEKQEKIETPKIVRRKVAYTTTKKVPYTIKMRVRVDSYGNSIGEPEAADAQWRAWFKAMEQQGKSTMISSKELESGSEVPADDEDENPKYDKSSIYYTAPGFRPLKSPKRKAADTVPSLEKSAVKETAGREKVAGREKTVNAKPTAASNTGSTPTVNTLGKSKVKNDSGARSILVPATEPDFTPATSMKSLGGRAIEIDTGANAAAVSNSDRKSVEDVMKNKFAAPPKAKVETSAKSTWETFDPQLIRQPRAPDGLPAVGGKPAISIPGIDRVDPLKRQPVNDIY